MSEGKRVACKCGQKIYVKSVCRKCYMKVYRNTPNQLEKRKKYNKEHYHKNIDWYNYRNRNLSPTQRTEQAKRIRDWAHKNRERVRELSRKNYWDKHDHSQAVGRIRSAQRRARVLQAMPKWADYNKIKEFYKNCPKGHVVDHIVPLKGKNVCGLHVEHNLQYLTVSENCKKYNKFEG